MSTSTASNTNEPPQENFHRASSLFPLVKRLLTGLLSFFLLQCELMKRAVNFIMGNPNRNETVSSTTVLPADRSALLFSSLPKDVILNCLARVPRRDYPIVSCVSKSFRSLMHSPELAHMRSSLGKDHPILYVCLTESQTSCFGRNFHWFTFNPNEKQTSGQNNSIQVLSQQKLYCSTVSIGSKIYFVGGSMERKSSGLRIFNSWSGKLCKGPRMKVARRLPGVAVVDGKIYVMGGCRERQIQVEVFDPKTRTWKVGPLICLNGEGLKKYMAVVTQAVALEGKVYGMNYSKRTHIYDTKDGRCETVNMPNVDTWRRGRVCVINHLIYTYYRNHGLIWYDSKDKVWKVVKGLERLDNILDMSVGMVDCNGKLAFVREDWRDSIAKTTEKRIWCTMIVLDRIGEEIHGTIEWDSSLVASVPYYYEIWRCLSVSG